MEQSHDYILGKRVMLNQPKYGYKAGLDAVFISSTLQLKAHMKIADLGSGVGAIALCLHARAMAEQIPITVACLERQKELVEMMEENILQNKAEGILTPFHQDLSDVPNDDFSYNSFDHVVCNPPYTQHKKGITPKNQSRAIAHEESSDISLKDWIKRAFKIVKPRGVVTFIHNAERTHEIVALFAKSGGEISIYPLFSSADCLKPAKRVIIQGRRGVKGGARIMQGMVIHEKNGDYTPQADNVLFHAHAIKILPHNR